MNTNSHIFKILQESQARERNVNYSGFKKNHKIDELPLGKTITSSVAKTHSSLGADTFDPNGTESKMKSVRGIGDPHSTLTHIRMKGQSRTNYQTLQSS